MSQVETVETNRNAHNPATGGGLGGSAPGAHASFSQTGDIGDWPYASGGGSPLDPSVPSNANSADNSSPGWLNKLQEFILKMSQDPNNIALGQNFLQYIMNLTQAGDLSNNNPYGQQANELLQSANVQTLIVQLIDQNAYLSYFQGFNGQQGDAGANEWINNLQNLLNGLGSSNPFTQAMSNELNHLSQSVFNNPIGNGSSFDQAHLKNGQYYWTVTLPNGQTVTYYWNPGAVPGSDPNGQEMIYQQIANSTIGSPLGPNPFWDNFSVNEFESEYRRNLLNTLLANYKDPTIAIVLFILMSNDDTLQNQLQGQANTTTALTDMTNLYITPLTEFFSGVNGSTTDDQVQAMINELNDADVSVNSQNCTGPIAKSFDQNTYQAIMNTVVGGALGPNATIGDYVSAGPSQLHNLNLALQTALTPQTPNGQNGPSAPTALQEILDAIQQGGGLVTQQTKTVSTISASITNTDNQVIKIASFATDPSKGGYAAFLKFLAEHEIAG